MASTGKCPYCGGTVTSEEKNCPHCGATNENYVVDTPRTILQPKTIDELKEYCAERGMPLLRMRFFIGENFKEPRAFGIYQDGDRFVVYKNKADGSRAIRYQGPDEAYAVNELYQKLLVECHNRGIYPDGQPMQGVTRTSGQQRKTKRHQGLRVYLAMLAAIILIVIISGQCSARKHRNDGYYRFDGTSAVWYLYGGSWYYSDDSSDNWSSGDPGVEDYQDYSLGTDYDSDWGVTDFKDSDTWDSIRSSSSSSDSSSSDYSSWDSGGTDWSSDW